LQYQSHQKLYFSIGDFVITNSIFTTFFVSLFFIIFAIFIFPKNLKSYPGANTLQNILEIIAEMFLNFYESIVGKKHAAAWFPFLTTIFFFILISSWSGLLPGVGSIGVWGIHHGEETLIPLFRAPTADLNTTLALAIIGMIFVQYQGFKTLGSGYLKKFFQFTNPILTFVGLLELLGEFTKIISFAFRLFGNIFAGEVLLAVISFLIPVLAATPFLGLEVFVGLIQSLVFVMLVLVFSATAMAKHH
jgi:F-type H+-transporting ATPase subunit a